MTQAEHYRDQSRRAQRLAEAVRDPEASKKLKEMVEEFLPNVSSRSIDRPDTRNLSLRLPSHAQAPCR
jgi:hypothetical protein